MSFLKIVAERAILSIVLLLFIHVANAFAVAPKTSVDAKETELHSGSNGVSKTIVKQSPSEITSLVDSDFENDFKLGLNLQLDTVKQQPSPLSTSSPSPIVHRNAAFTVNRTSNIIYASSVVCRVGCAGHSPGNSSIPGFNASANCVCPSFFNLTLDLYTPVGAEGLRPGFVAIHSGGYSHGDKEGFKKEMEKACEYFAARGYVAISMTYRLAAQGGLSPANWTNNSIHPPSGWAGGFDPSSSSVYPGVRDAKAAIRWFRSNAREFSLDVTHVGAGGWSAGACTTVHLASSFEWDFTTEMNATTDPSFHTIHADGVSSLIQAGVVWAGNPVVTDMKSHSDGLTRYLPSNAPLALYRGAQDTTMTQWGQDEVKRMSNETGARVDLFLIPDVGHTSLFPGGMVTNSSGRMPVLNHSFNWMSEAMGLTVVD